MNASTRKTSSFCVHNHLPLLKLNGFQTYMLDEKRLIDLKLRTFQLTSIATVLLVTISNAGPDLQSIAPFKQSLKEHISILLQSVKTEKYVFPEFVYTIIR